MYGVDVASRLSLNGKTGGEKKDGYGNRGYLEGNALGRAHTERLDRRVHGCLMLCLDS